MFESKYKTARFFNSRLLFKFIIPCIPKETERQRETERERDRQRQAERGREREGERKGEREREREGWGCLNVA